MNTMICVAEKKDNLQLNVKLPPELLEAYYLLANPLGEKRKSQAAVAAVVAMLCLTPAEFRALLGQIGFADNSGQWPDLIERARSGDLMLDVKELAKRQPQTYGLAATGLPPKRKLR